MSEYTLEEITIRLKRILERMDVMDWTTTHVDLIELHNDLALNLPGIPLLTDHWTRPAENFPELWKAQE